MAYYYFDGHIAITDPGTVWTNDANAFDNDLTTAAHCATAGSSASNYLYGQGTNCPTSGPVIGQVNARIWVTGNGSVVNGTCNVTIYTASLAETLGSGSDNGNSGLRWVQVKLTPPSAGWTWTVLNALEVKIWQSGGSGTPNVDAYAIELIVDSSNSFEGGKRHLSVQSGMGRSDSAL